MKTMIKSVAVLCGCLWLAATAQGASTIVGYNANVSETNAVAVVQVERTDGLETAVTLEYYTEEGTATNGGDYAATSGTLTFLPGISNVTVSIPLINDGMPELSEYFTLVLTNATGGAIISGTAPRIYITDNDLGIRFSSVYYTNSEHAGFAVLTVLRGEDEDFPATVTYSTANMSALAGSDYVATNGTLEFAADELNKTLAIPLINDFIPENLETFRVQLSAVTGPTALGTPANAMVRIEDNDVGIQIEQATYAVHYAASSVTIGILADPQVNETATVEFYTTNGTALAGVDYGATNGTLTFGPGQTYQTVTIPLLNSGEFTNNKSFSLRLGTVTGPTALGTKKVATINISDLSFLPYSFSGPTNTWTPYWVDYDNDGQLELIMYGDYWATNACGVYENPGDGTLVRITNNILATTAARWGALAWADFDNDGDLDCYAGMWEGMVNRYFRNDGGGVFTPILMDRNWIANGVDAYGSVATAVDLDGDGILDVVGSYFGNQGGYYGTNRVLRGLGDGRFEAILNSPLALSGIWTETILWADQDNDGDMDPYIITSGYTTNLDYIYRNEGGMNFTLVTNLLSPVPSGRIGAAWGDYDNDGDWDLWTSGGNLPNTLFLNDGHGQFTPDSSTLTIAGGLSAGWADYDNDGHLDLFITYAGTRAKLYRNNGDGTLTELPGAGPATMIIDSYMPAWGDYNNDGFMDLAAASATGNYLLFRNNLPNLGNSNHWLKIKLTGTQSNRSGIGAKIRVKATISGKTFWQLRQIASQSNFAELIAHFGLGDAAVAEVVRIEWPSGMVQELTNVVANQILTVTEPPRCVAPCVMGGKLEFTLTGNLGDTFELLEADAVDSQNWTVRQTITLTNRTQTISEPANPTARQKYYQIRRVP